LADLGRIQNLLKTDAHYRERFLKDPIGALAEQGLILPNEMHFQVRQMVAQAQTPAHPVPGAAAGPGGWSETKFASGAWAATKGIPLIIAFE